MSAGVGAIPVISWEDFLGMYGEADAELPLRAVDHAGIMVFLPIEASVNQVAAMLTHFARSEGSAIRRLCFVTAVPATALAPWYVALPPDGVMPC